MSFSPRGLLEDPAADSLVSRQTQYPGRARTESYGCSDEQDFLPFSDAGLCSSDAEGSAGGKVRERLLAPAGQSSPAWAVPPAALRVPCQRQHQDRQRPAGALHDRADEARTGEQRVGDSREAALLHRGVLGDRQTQHGRGVEVDYREDRRSDEGSEDSDASLDDILMDLGSCTGPVISKPVAYIENYVVDSNPAKPIKRKKNRPMTLVKTNSVDQEKRAGRRRCSLCCGWFFGAVFTVSSAWAGTYFGPMLFFLDGDLSLEMLFVEEEEEWDEEEALDEEEPAEVRRGAQFDVEQFDVGTEAEAAPWRSATPDDAPTEAHARRRTRSTSASPAAGGGRWQAYLPAAMSELLPAAFDRRQRQSAPVRYLLRSLTVKTPAREKREWLAHLGMERVREGLLGRGPLGILRSDRRALSRDASSSGVGVPASLAGDVVGTSGTPADVPLSGTAGPASAPADARSTGVSEMSMEQHILAPPLPPSAVAPSDARSSRASARPLRQEREIPDDAPSSVQRRHHRRNNGNGSRAPARTRSPLPLRSASGAGRTANRRQHSREDGFARGPVAAPRNKPQPTFAFYVQWHYLQTEVEEEDSTSTRRVRLFAFPADEEEIMLATYGDSSGILGGRRGRRCGSEGEDEGMRSSCSHATNSASSRSFSCLRAKACSSRRKSARYDYYTPLMYCMFEESTTSSEFREMGCAMILARLAVGAVAVRPGVLTEKQLFQFERALKELASQNPLLFYATAPDARHIQLVAPADQQEEDAQPRPAGTEPRSFDGRSRSRPSPPIHLSDEDGHGLDGNSTREQDRDAQAQGHLQDPRSMMRTRWSAPQEPNAATQVTRGQYNSFSAGGVAQLQVAPPSLYQSPHLQPSLYQYHGLFQAFALQHRAQTRGQQLLGCAAQGAGRDLPVCLLRPPPWNASTASTSAPAPAPAPAPIASTTTTTTPLSTTTAASPCPPPPANTSTGDEEEQLEQKKREDSVTVPRSLETSVEVLRVGVAKPPLQQGAAAGVADARGPSVHTGELARLFHDRLFGKGVVDRLVLFSGDAHDKQFFLARAKGDGDGSSTSRSEGRGHLASVVGSASSLSSWIMGAGRRLQISEADLERLLPNDEEAEESADAVLRHQVRVKFFELLTASRRDRQNTFPVGARWHVVEPLEQQTTPLPTGSDRGVAVSRLHFAAGDPAVQTESERREHQRTFHDKNSEAAQAHASRESEPLTQPSQGDEEDRHTIGDDMQSPSFPTLSDGVDVSPELFSPEDDPGAERQSFPVPPTCIRDFLARRTHGRGQEDFLSTEPE